jgi:hypothetical protein
MSVYSEFICPCTTRQARYKKYSPDTLTPPSGSKYSTSLSLGMDIDAHCLLLEKLCEDELLLQGIWEFLPNFAKMNFCCRVFGNFYLVFLLQYLVQN